jgi:hypothetical protein
MLEELMHDMDMLSSKILPSRFTDTLMPHLCTAENLNLQEHARGADG